MTWIECQKKIGKREKVGKKLGKLENHLLLSQVRSIANRHRVEASHCDSYPGMDAVIFTRLR